MSKKSKLTSWDESDGTNSEHAHSKELKSSERIQRVRSRYYESLPKKLDELKLCWADYRENETEESLSSFFRFCHNMGGSAGAYELPSLCEKSRLLEAILLEQLESQTSMTQGCLQKVEGLCQDLENELRTLIAMPLHFPLGSVDSLEEHVLGDSSPVFAVADSGSIPTPVSMSSMVYGTVLVVEDDEFQAEDIRCKLEESHFACCIAHSGAEALLKASEIGPDLILLDLVLEGMDGFQIYEKLREIPGCEATPVIFLSSIQRETEIVRAYQLGAFGYLTKPIAPIILTSKLFAALLHSQVQNDTAPSPARLIPGLVLDRRFRVMQPLGSGGGGFVYQVEDLDSGEFRALKLLDVISEQDQTNVFRFQREIEAIRKLKHPHLVRLFNVGLADGALYYTMSLLPNGDLAHRLREEGAIPVLEALTLWTKIGGAVQHLHEHNLIHRDLKPENVMFSEEHEPVLTDLGLVFDMNAINMRLTQKGHAVGTPQYMAPEQLLQPENVDHRIDVYAMGVLLFELLTGFHPFNAMGHMEAMAAALQQGYPSLSLHMPAPHPGLVAICKKALQKDPNDRYDDMAKMLEAIEQVKQELSQAS